MGWVVAVCTALAAAGRALLLPIDRRLQHVDLPTPLRRPAARWGAAAVVAASAVALLVADGAVDAVEHQYDTFVSADTLSAHDAVRDRLVDPANNGRVRQWKVALDAFEHEPARGREAGTFALEWDRHRPAEYQIEDAHSHYLEILGELGIIGLLLVTAAIILVLAGFAARARGPDRVAGSALFGAGLGPFMPGSTGTGRCRS